MSKKLLFCAIMLLALSALVSAQNIAPVRHRAIAGNQNTEIVLPYDTEEDQIAYDDGPGRYFPSYTTVGTKFEVRFTPLQACTLSYIKVASYNGAGSALIHVWSDSGGIPGHDLRTPQTVTLNGTLAFQQINISPRLDMGSTDFHVGIEYTRVPPPYATADSTATATNRSKFKRPTDATWQALTLDLNIRAFVRYYGADMVPPVIESPWRIFGFTLEGTHPITATITDASGIQNGYVHYSLDGSTYDSVAMTNSSGNIWVGQIPNQPEGSIVRYYISATDNSLNHNRSIIPPNGSTEPYTMTIVRGRELVYDDGTADAYWIVDTSFMNNAFAIRMTPTFYPAKVTMARALFNGESAMDFTLNGVSAGAPGAVLPGGEAVETSAEPHGWAIASFPNGPTITSGSFFCLVHWLPDTPDDPAVGEDTMSTAMRSYWYSDSSSWNTVTDGDWVIRTVITTPSGIYEVGPDGVMPAKFELLGNYPNPFNPSTDIQLYAPSAGNAQVDVYNIAGQLVKTVYNGYVEAGVKTINWDGRDARGNQVGSGVYFYKLTADGQSDVGRMVMLK
jgi:hypothetical protein